MNLRRRIPIVLRRWLGIAPLALVAGCVVFSGPDDSSTLRAELDRAKRAWSEAHTVDYDYVLQRQCFCTVAGLQVRVSVRGGVVVSTTVEPDGVPLAADLRGMYPPVEGLFAVLQDALDHGAYRVTASYNAGLGYPTQFFIDYSEHIADEEQGYTSTDFSPVLRIAVASPLRRSGAPPIAGVRTSRQ
jgi:Family of unknown function (DUF6174)